MRPVAAQRRQASQKDETLEALRSPSLLENIELRLSVGSLAPRAQASKKAAFRKAKTIHRLLEFNPKKFGFDRDASNPLEADLVILDEASMIDTVLAYAPALGPRSMPVRAAYPRIKGGSRSRRARPATVACGRIT